MPGSMPATRRLRARPPTSWSAARHELAALEERWLDLETQRELTESAPGAGS